jgi:hypothetical protein
MRWHMCAHVGTDCRRRQWPQEDENENPMKLGSTTHLAAKLFSCALICMGAACGSRTSLLQDDAGTSTDSVSQQPTGGRASGGSNAARAGRGAAGTAAAAAGRTAQGGRGAQPGRGGEDGNNPSAGRGGDDDADSGAGEEQPRDAGAEQGGSGGEGAAGSGGEGTAGSAGEAAGTGGMDAAGSGGTPATEEPVLRMVNLTPEQVTTLCGRIDAQVMNLPWEDGINGYCSRRGLSQPDMCVAIRDQCNTQNVVPVCADTIPVCPNITVDEFVQCRIDTLTQFVNFYRDFSCDTQPPLADWTPVQSCAGPHERCPPMVPLTL